MNPSKVYREGRKTGDHLSGSPEEASGTSKEVMFFFFLKSSAWASVAPSLAAISGGAWGDGEAVCGGGACWVVGVSSFSMRERERDVADLLRDVGMVVIRREGGTREESS